VGVVNEIRHREAVNASALAESSSVAPYASVCRPESGDVRPPGRYGPEHEPVHCESDSPELGETLGGSSSRTRNASSESSASKSSGCSFARRCGRSEFFPSAIFESSGGRRAKRSGSPASERSPAESPRTISDGASLGAWISTSAVPRAAAKKVLGHSTDSMYSRYAGIVVDEV
jgi:hypothetical protein